MIIWLNGPFGVGKTSLANLLHQEIPNSILYDPELLGDFFQENLPKAVCPDDFQDYPIWRQITVQIIRDLATKTGQVIIVPMTVFKKEYYQEIIEQGLRKDMFVRHYLLVAEKETILDRLNKRTQENNNWLTVNEIADLILKDLNP